MPVALAPLGGIAVVGDDVLQAMFSYHFLKQMGDSYAPS
jgi:hypothetical protein